MKNSRYKKALAISPNISAASGQAHPEEAHTEDEDHTMEGYLRFNPYISRNLPPNNTNSSFNGTCKFLYLLAFCSPAHEGRYYGHVSLENLFDLTTPNYIPFLLAHLSLGCLEFIPKIPRPT